MGVLCVNNIWLAFTLDSYHFSIVYNYTFAKSIKFKRISHRIKCPTLKDYSAKSLGTFHSDWVLHVPHNNLYCSWWTCKYMCTLHCSAFVCVFVFKVVDMIACIFSIFAMSLYQMNKSSCVCGWVNAWIMCSNKAHIGEKGDERVVTFAHKNGSESRKLQVNFNSCRKFIKVNWISCTIPHIDQWPLVSNAHTCACRTYIYLKDAACEWFRSPCDWMRLNLNT